jgi:hypothetical protein
MNVVAWKYEEIQWKGNKREKNGTSTNEEKGTLIITTVLSISTTWNDF